MTPGDVPLAVQCVGDAPASLVSFQDYWGVHLEGAGPLIQSWMWRAESALNEGEPFECFIFTWIAFNGWAERGRGEERDVQWIRRLASCQPIRTDFSAFLAADQEAASLATALRDFAPVFRAREQRALPPPPSPARAVRVAYWLGKGVGHRPECFAAHHEGMPIDWPHLLHAIYQVRCNLFHGEKSIASDVDRDLVTWASRILLPFLRFTGYADWQPRNTVAARS